MKFAYKLALTTSIISIISIVALLFAFDYYNHRSNEVVVYENIESRTTFISGQINEHIDELVILT